MLEKLSFLMIMIMILNGCLDVANDGEKKENKDFGVEIIKRTGKFEQLNWFKSKSESEIEIIDNGVVWSPVKKPTTLHTYFNPVEFKVGKTIKFKMNWESDGRDGSNKEFSDPHKSDPTDQGKGISDRYLRLLAGTGDFRVGFFQSDTKVGNNTYEGRKDGATKEFNNYKGFQVRIHPHIGEGFKDINRLTEEHDSGKRESHANFQMWTRFKPGKYGLMSDEAQNAEDDYADGRSFSKSDKWGHNATGWGPNAPFGKATPFVFELTRTSDTEFEAVVTLNGNSTPLLTGKFDKDFKPEFFDTLAITYTNSSRRYEYVKITDFQVDADGAQEEEENTNGKGLVVEAEHVNLIGFQTAYHTDASNDKYIYSMQNNTGEAKEEAKAVFSFNVSEAGKYSVTAKTSSLQETKDANSFYVKINNGKIEPYYTKRTSNWVDSDLGIFDMAEGINTVTIYAREAKTCLDKITLVAQDEDASGGSGDNNLNQDKYDLDLLDENEAEHPGIDGSGNFPESKGYKAPGVDSPWSIIIGKDDGPLNEYIQKKWINRGVAQWDNEEKALLWRPRYVWVDKDDDNKQVADGEGKRKLVNKNMTVWRKLSKKLYFDNKKESSVKVKMMWKMDTKAIPEDNKPEEDYNYDFDSQENVLRGLRGTGDFRLCLLEGIFSDNGEVITDTKTKKTMAFWPGYQVRFNPFVHKKLGEWTGANDNSNASHWYRDKPAPPVHPGIADDWCQSREYDNHAGWDKIRTETGLKFPLASHAPFDEWFPVEVTITRREDDGKYYYQSTFDVNGDNHILKEYRFEIDNGELKGTGDSNATVNDMKKLDYVDTLAISFTNIRPYGTVHIKIDELVSDVEEDNSDNDDSNDDEEEVNFTFDKTNKDVKNAYEADLKGADYSSKAKVGSHSLNFNGGNDYAKLPVDLAKTDEFTFAVWLKWDRISNWQRIFSAGKDRDNVMFLTPKDSKGKIRFRIEKNGDKQEIRTDYRVKEDEWTHIAVTLDGEKGVIYVNGEKVESSNINYVPNDIDIEEFWLGKSQFDDPNLNGRLDDLKIYKRALSEDEIKKMQ